MYKQSISSDAGKEPQPISDVCSFGSRESKALRGQWELRFLAARRGFAQFGAREDPVLPSALCRSKEQTGAGPFAC